jgi:hypothetical protein
MQRFFFDLVGDVPARILWAANARPKRKPVGTRRLLPTNLELSVPASLNPATGSQCATSGERRYSRYPSPWGTFSYSFQKSASLVSTALIARLVSRRRFLIPRAPCSSDRISCRRLCCLLCLEEIIHRDIERLIHHVVKLTHWPGIHSRRTRFRLVQERDPKTNVPMAALFRGTTGGYGSIRE